MAFKIYIMRFNLKIGFKYSAQKHFLPINYQYELSAWIYKVIESGDNEYSAWLHENGFRNNNKQYRLFSFSNLKIPSLKIKEDSLLIDCDYVELEISFLPEKSTEEFVKGLFRKREFVLGNRKYKTEFIVEDIQIMPEPIFQEEMSYKSISPICVSRRREEKGSFYPEPTDTCMAESILTNLISKYEAFYGIPLQLDFAKCDFNLTSIAKRKLITIKADTPYQSRVPAYMYEFCLKVPVELQQIAYHCGVGHKNSVGFGAIALKTK